MRKSTSILAALAASAFLALPVFGQTRIDTNGEMVNNSTAGGTNGVVPYGWTAYGSGGLAGKFDTGSSSNTQNINQEDESVPITANPGASTSGTLPNGHSVVFGQGSAANAYGIKQTYNVTAANASVGMIYWLSGGETASADWTTTNQTQYAFDYGVEIGTGIGGGKLSSGNIRPPSGKLGDTTVPGDGGRFSHAIYAPPGTTQITAHVGLKSNVASPGGINVFADGIRVYQIPVVINTSLQNGNFEASGTQDISKYNALGASPIYMQQDLVPGWVPLGGAAAQEQMYNLDTAADANVHGGTNSFQFDAWKGSGRAYAAQRVDSGGPGTYTFASYVKSSTTDSHSKIGIDPTGGMDPTAASVQWFATDASTAQFDLQTLVVNDLTGNGVTLFMASGTDYATFTSTNNRSGGHMGGFFDDMTLTYVPEPATLALLALGSVMLTGRRRRA